MASLESIYFYCFKIPFEVLKKILVPLIVLLLVLVVVFMAVDDEKLLRLAVLTDLKPVINETNDLPIEIIESALENLDQMGNLTIFDETEQGSQKQTLPPSLNFKNQQDRLYNTNSSKFILASYLNHPQLKKLFDINIESDISAIRHYKFGFRKEKTSFPKKFLLDDLSRIPEEYFESTGTRALTKTEKIIEGHLDFPNFIKLVNPKFYTDIKVMILVKTAIHHINFRSAIRQTWAQNLPSTSNPKISYLFLVAKNFNNKLAMKNLSAEQNQFQDILVGER